MADAEFQPLTGEPGLIETKAAHYARIAEAIDRSVRFLNAVRDMDGMVSQAVGAVSGKSGEISDDIGKAFDRYNATSTALLSYAGALRDAQGDAARAVAEIEHRQAAADAANHAATAAQSTADHSADADKDDAAQKANRAAAAAQGAAEALAAAQAAWHAAWDKKNQAAKTAAGKIADVVTGSKNHGLKEQGGVLHAISEGFHALFKLFKTMCDVAGILSVFLSWVPILGEVLIAMAAIGAIIDLVTTIVNGGSFTDILLASVNVVLTLVGGKLIGEMAKGLKIASTAKVTEKMLVEGRDAKAMSTEINHISGVAGRHVTGAVNFSSRADAIRYLDKTRESVPSFGEMTSNAFKKSFLPRFGGKTKREVFVDGLKTNFTPYGLGGKDLYQLNRVVFRNSTGVDTKLSAQYLGVTGLQIGKDAFDIHKIESKPGWGHNVPALGKGWSKLGDAPGAVVELGHDAGALVRAGERLRMAMTRDISAALDGVSAPRP